MSTALTSWYDYVLPDVPGLPPGTAALNLIRDGAVEFCTRSQALEIDHPPMDLVSGTATYAFAPGSGLAVVAPKNVLVNGKTITASNDDDLDFNFGDAWRNGTLATGPAIAYRMPDESNIQIIPTPPDSVVGGIVMRVAVKPTGTVTDVPDRLFAQMTFRNAISAYAKWQAKESPGKPYSDPTGAAYWMYQFNCIVGAADIQAAKGHTRRPLRSRTISGIV
jgi:hypothetical protein